MRTTRHERLAWKSIMSDFHDTTDEDDVCSVCAARERTHGSQHSPMRAFDPGLASSYYVGFHHFTLMCHTTPRTVYEDVEIIQALGVSHVQAMRRARVCWCPRCRASRRRIVLEQHILDGHEWAVYEYLELERRAGEE